MPITVTKSINPTHAQKIFKEQVRWGKILVDATEKCSNIGVKTKPWLKSAVCAYGVFGASAIVASGGVLTPLVLAIPPAFKKIYKDVEADKLATLKFVRENGYLLTGLRFLNMPLFENTDKEGLVTALNNAGILEDTEFPELYFVRSVAGLEVVLGDPHFLMPFTPEQKEIIKDELTTLHAITPGLRMVQDLVPKLVTDLKEAMGKKDLGLALQLEKKILEIEDACIPHEDSDDLIEF